MKVLVIYSTSGGVSRTCAEMLKDRLDGGAISVALYDIKDNPPSPEGYDVAVIGGSVRMGRISKRLKNYLRTHEDALGELQTALFLCCGYTENFDDYVALNFPKSIIPSLGIHCFGGELKPEKLRGFDKFVVKMVRSDILNEDFEHPDPTKSPLPEIVPENIWRLADAIRGLL